MKINLTEDERFEAIVALRLNVEDMVARLKTACPVDVLLLTGQITHCESAIAKLREARK